MVLSRGQKPNQTNKTKSQIETPQSTKNQNGIKGSEFLIQGKLGIQDWSGIPKTAEIHIFSNASQITAC